VNHCGSGLLVRMPIEVYPNHPWLLWPGPIPRNLLLPPALAAVIAGT